MNVIATVHLPLPERIMRVVRAYRSVPTTQRARVLDIEKSELLIAVKALAARGQLIISSDNETIQIQI